MKIVYKYLILLCPILILIISGAGCKKNLEKSPLGSYEPSSFYNNENNATQAVFGLYNVLHYEGTFDYCWQIFNEWSTDNFESGFGTTLYNNMVNINTNVSTTDQGVLTTWRAHYEGITRANLLIAGVQNASFTEAKRKRFIAEAKFIRALLYFNLVNYYGKVPLILVPTNPQDALKIPQSSVQDVYLQIEKDLTEANTDLPQNTNNTEYGRISGAAATALLGKAYLYQKKYEQAAQTFKLIINNSNYSLVTGQHAFRSLFTLAGERNNEVIFSIINDDLGSPWSEQQGQGASFQQYYMPPGFGGWSSVQVPQNLVDAFESEADTVRKAGTIMTEFNRIVNPGYRVVPLNYTLLSGEQFVTSVTGNDIGAAPGGGISISKYIGSIDKSYNPALNPIDQPIIRLADIYLMYAEAQTLKSTPDLEEAKLYLNLVRQRSALPPLTTNSANALNEAIRKERRLELAYEGHRLFDLKRWGIYIETMNSLGRQFSAKCNLLPIPQIEIDLSSGVLKQNEGW